MEDTYKVEILTQFFNIKNDSNKLEELNIKENLTVRRNRNTSDFIIPKFQNNSFKISHQYQMPYLWNHVPRDIRDVKEVYKFRSLFKTELISKYIYKIYLK